MACCGPTLDPAQRAGRVRAKIRKLGLPLSGEEARKVLEFKSPENDTP